MDAAQVEEAVRTAVDFVIPIIEVIGAAVVFYGAIAAIVQYVASALGIRHASYEQIRLTLGRHLALGLEFQLGSDILGTAVSPSFAEIGKLGAIAAIRTVLNLFLQRELKEEAERVAAQRGDEEHAGQLVGPGTRDVPADGSARGPADSGPRRA